MKIVDRRTTPDGASKYLLECEDGSRVESVFFQMDDARNKDALCISSQVGCTLSCSFCVTGTLGLKRNLTAAEIATQVTTILEDVSFVPDRKHEVAYMGMGEPLYNLGAVLESRLIVRERFPDMKFSISTVGIVPGIERLCKEATDMRLQISMHSADNSMRTKIMAINRRYPISEVLDAAERFAAASGHLVNINYVLMVGVNDSEESALRLARTLKDRPFLIQLVVVNPDKRIPYRSPDTDSLERFSEILRSEGLDPFHSTQLGIADGAGCGQLDAEYSEKFRRRPVAPADTA